jgi:F-type H+-transporting ATPase subunit alpha
MNNVHDILSKIEEQINSTNLEEHFSKQGEILEIKDGVALVSGLDDVMFSEIVTFENNMKGLVLDLLPEYV